MTSQFVDEAFWRCFLSLVKCSYWFKSHISIITDCGVMTIYFYKELTWNPEIRNTPIWDLPNIWRLERVRYTKFGTDVSNEMLLNATKCLAYSFYRSWVIKGQPTDVCVSVCVCVCGGGRGGESVEVNLGFSRLRILALASCFFSST